MEKQTRSPLITCCLPHPFLSAPWWSQVIELYRLLTVGVSLWNQFAVPILFTVFWLVLFVVQLCSNTMSANTAAGQQGLLFLLLSRCDPASVALCLHDTAYVCTNLYNSALFSAPTVSLNVAPHHTHCWAWPSWCPISLWDCSIYANSTWEAMLLFRMRTSCTGGVFLYKCCFWRQILFSLGLVFVDYYHKRFSRGLSLV